MNLKLSDFDVCISLGDNCATALALKDLQFHKETFPFDWVRTTTEIIYDSLITDFSNYSKFGETSEKNFYLSNLFLMVYPNFPKSHINFYGQYFTHYLNNTSDEISEILTRRKYRLNDYLSSNKKILFIRSTESYIYDKPSRDRADLYWNYLIKIEKYLSEKYPRLEFKILNIESNTERKSVKNIFHFNIDFPLEYQDKHNNRAQEPLYNLYRRLVLKTLKELI